MLGERTYHVGARLQLGNNKGENADEVLMQEAVINAVLIPRTTTHSFFLSSWSTVYLPAPITVSKVTPPATPTFTKKCSRAWRI